MVVFKSLKRIFCSALICGGLAETLNLAHAEIITDGSMGPATQLGGPDFAVTQELGQTVGGNLFHSFSRFNLASGQSATFSGANSIDNVIARVTGGTSSVIDGLLRSSIPGADLIFVNPSGIVFGENATLDIKGSFTASTANTVEFEDGGLFRSDLSAGTVLTSAPVSAFGFINPNPAEVRVQGSLRLSPEQELSIISGDIYLEGGQLKTENADTRLVSVASSGRITAEALNEASAIDALEVKSLGRIEMRDDAQVATEQGGRVVIRGGRLVLINDAAITATSETAAHGGDIDIEVSAKTDVLSQSTIETNVTGTGNGGDVLIKANSVRVDGVGSSIGANNHFEGEGGSAGNVLLDITEQVAVSKGALIESETKGVTQGGDVSIRAQSLLIDNQGVIAGFPYVGFNLIPAGGGIYVSNGSLVFEGQPGHIDIQVEALDIRGGGTISTHTMGSGDAGDISITANTIFIDGQGATTPTGIDSRNLGMIPFLEIEMLLEIADEFGLPSDPVLLDSLSDRADTGNIFINVADSLTMTNSIASENSAGTSIAVENYGRGQGGSLQIRAGNVSIDAQGDVLDLGRLFSSGVGIYARSLRPGVGGAAGDIDIEVTGKLGIFEGGAIATGTLNDSNAGSIEAKATDAILLDTGALIQSESRGAGSAGSIALDAGQRIAITEDAFLSTSALIGDAGSITVQATNTIYLENSSIQATAGRDGGSIALQAIHEIGLFGSELTAQAGNNGGTLSIDPVITRIERGSILNANALRGNGGSITIKTQYLFQSDDSILTASSELGLAGDVLVQTLDLGQVPVLVELQGELLNAHDSLPAHCGVRTQGKSSSFIVTSSEGIKWWPDAWQVGMRYLSENR